MPFGGVPGLPSTMTFGRGGRLWVRRLIWGFGTCIVIWQVLMTFTQRESCGKCVPCASEHGTMVRFSKGLRRQAELADLDKLRRSAARSEEVTLCLVPRPESCAHYLIFARIIATQGQTSRRTCRKRTTGSIGYPGMHRSNAASRYARRRNQRPRSTAPTWTRQVSSAARAIICRFDAIAGDAIVIES